MLPSRDDRSSPLQKRLQGDRIYFIGIVCEFIESRLGFDAFVRPAGFQSATGNLIGGGIWRDGHQRGHAAGGGRGVPGERVHPRARAACVDD